MIYLKQLTSCEPLCSGMNYESTIKELQSSIELLDSKILHEELSLGSYNIPAGQNQNINVRYIPKAGYELATYAINYPSRYVGGLRYLNNAFQGSIFNISNNSGTYQVSVLILLIRV